MSFCVGGGRWGGGKGVKGLMQVECGCGGRGGLGVSVVSKNFVKIRVIGVRGRSGGCGLLFSEVAEEQGLSSFFFLLLEFAMPYGEELFAITGSESQGVE